MSPDEPLLISGGPDSNNPFKKRVASFLVFVGAISILFVIFILAGVVWYVVPKTSLNPGADDTPLPRGILREPSISLDDSRSNLRFHFRITLASLQRILNKAIPREFSVPSNDMGATGQIKREDLQISAREASRIQLDSQASFTGSAKWGFWEVKSAKVNLAGSTLSLDVSPDWNWLIAPQIKAKITEIDVKLAPDSLVKWIGNEFFVPHVAAGFSSTPPFAFRPLVESFWRDSNQDIQILGDPLTVVGLRPQSVTLGGPLLERDGSATLMVGLDVQSWSALGQVGKSLGLQQPVQLPALQKTPVTNETTELRLPVLVSLQDAPRFFQPQTLQVPGGTLKILNIELSEKDGVCYIRGRVRFDVTEGQAMARPFSGETTLVIQGRPSCDSVTGEIHFQDLAFTPKSDSILVQILGQGANTLRGQLQELAPILSGWVKNRLESHLNAEAEKFLKAQIQAWSSAVPEFETEIRTAHPSIKNIQIKPIRLETSGGYFVLVIQARADLGLAIP
jgi:hypothetical protein